MSHASETFSLSECGFSIPLVINFEDTDAAGVVYYANYLGFMERARNAYLRSLGLSLSQLADEQTLLFVVTEVHVKYSLPARLDDQLHITARVVKFGRASLVFHQQVIKDGQELVNAEIKLGILNSQTLKPMRMPDLIRDALIDNLAFEN